MYPDMCDVLDEGQSGKFALQKFEVSRDNIRAVLIDGIPPGRYIRLTDGCETVMSNTLMEQRTNREVIRKANGNVFIAGLGIGMILLPMQEKENVLSITVLEKYQEVIDLVALQLPLNDKVKILKGDVFGYQFPKGTKFDTLYFDVWSYINADIYTEMQQLKKLYRKYKVFSTVNPNAFMGCWAEWEAKKGRRP